MHNCHAALLLRPFVQFNASRLLFISSTEKYHSLFGRSRLAYAVAPPPVALPESSVTHGLSLDFPRSTQQSHFTTVRYTNEAALYHSAPQPPTRKANQLVRSTKPQGQPSRTPTMCALPKLHSDGVALYQPRTPTMCALQQHSDDVALLPIVRSPRVPPKPWLTKSHSMEIAIPSSRKTTNSYSTTARKTSPAALHHFAQISTYSMPPSETFVSYTVLFSLGGVGAQEVSRVNICILSTAALGDKVSL
jgi:hypothetical protein